MPNKKQQDFSKEFINEAQKKGGFKTLGGVVGLPDHEDWQNIVRLINRYRKASIKKYGYDILVESIAEAKKEHTVAGNRYDRYSGEYQLVNEGSNMRHVFELPESFVHAIERVYPLMFSEVDHFQWFARHFRELRIPDKY